MKKIGVVSKDGNVLWRKQRKTSLHGRWDTVPFYITIKILFLMAATSSVLYGLVLLVQGNDEDSAVVWMLAFTFMGLVWAIEVKLRSDNSLYKTED